MDTVQYEELKQKLKRFEELSKQKEELGDKIERLKIFKNEGENIYVQIDSLASRIYFDSDISENICDAILDVLEIKLKQTHLEIENL